MKIPSILLLALLLVGSLPAQNKALTESQREHLRELWKEKYRPATAETPQNTAATPPLSTLKTNGSGEMKVSSNTVTDEGEPFIMVNPNDSNNVVVSYMDFTNGLNFPIYYTLDGGNTWSLSNFSTADTLTTMHPTWTIGGGGDPVFAYDNNGRLYFSYLYLSQDPNNQNENPMEMLWAWSDDKGQTWRMADDWDDRYIGQGSLVFGGLGIGSAGDGIFDRQWMAVDRTGGTYDGNLYVSYLFVGNQTTTLPGDGICIRRMAPGALKWDSTHIKVTPGSDVQFSNVAVDGNGNVHLSYGETSGGGATGIRHMVSTDGGVTWSTPHNVASVNYPRPLFTWEVHSRENANPNMAIDPVSNDVYMVWGSVSGGSIEGFFSVSTDMGTSWSQPLNIASLRNQNVQVLMPSVAANDQGVVSVSWFELNANDIGHFYIAESFDGGSTFDPPTQLSAATTDFSSGTFQTFYGDYYTSVRSGCTTWSAWSDGRNNLGPKLYIAKSCKCSSTPVNLSEVSPLTTEIALNALYPNPVSDVLRVELALQLEAQAHISLVDVQGRTVLEIFEGQLAAGQKDLNVQVDQLAPGNYLLKVDSELGLITRKVVKQ